MSVIKTALVLSVAIAILPSDRAQQERLYVAVSSAAQWSTTYCDRNPTTCDTAHSAWQSFVAKAEFAGKVAYGVAVRYAFGDGQMPERSPQSAEPVRLDYPKTRIMGTLTSRDLEPVWRGRTASKGI